MPVSHDTRVVGGKERAGQRTDVNGGDKQTERFSFFININGKIPLRNGSGLDDKPHLFILFGDGDKLFTVP